MRMRKDERRGWVLIAALAIGIAFVSLLDLHAAPQDGVARGHDLRSQVANWLLPASELPLLQHKTRAAAPSTTGASSGWVAILPILIVGFISPLSLLVPLTAAYVGRAPQAPALAFRFQRPPPLRRA